MRYLSVCSGIEAATVAWHPLGWEPAAFSEIEAFPRAVLQHHYPGVPLHGDFTTIHGDEYGPVDLLVGGTPCQSFSVAGLRKGLDDERGNLALEFLRLLDRTRARWMVWENVPGVFSATSHDAPDSPPPDIDLDAGDGPEDGQEIVVEDSYDSDESHAFACFLAGLQELGYGFAYRVLDAQHAGVPQRRRRVFVVGYLGDWRRAAAVLFERHSLSGYPAPRREAGEGIAPTISARTRGGGGLGTDFDCDGGLISDVAFPLTAREGKGPNSDCDSGNLIAHTLRAEGFDASEDGTGRGTPLVPVGCFDDPRRFDARGIHRGGEHGELHPPLNQTVGQQVVAFSCKDHGADAGSLAPTLRAMGHGASHANAGGQVAVAIQERATSDSDTSGPGGKGWQEGVAYTMEARHRPQHVAHSMAVRRITPTEAERLQGFPDGYTLVPYRGKPAADGPRYKALGNSMAVPCMKWLGERIAAVEALNESQTEAAA